LERKGMIVVYEQIDRASDKVLITARDPIFASRDELDYFKEWFGSDYR
jgi:hypothetical protein